MTQQPSIDRENLLRSMTTNERGPYIDRSTIPTLDLHGCFLEPAIKKLVQFLEQYYEKPKARMAATGTTPLANTNESSNDIVQVITGTGSHSTSAGGPVLKYAVNDFLLRHSFLYKFYSKGGYFVIPLHNNTGVLSYQSNACNVSTKIILKTPETVDKTFGNHLKRSRMTTSRGLKSDQLAVLVPTVELPTLQEVVHEEKNLQRGVDESLEEYRKRQREYSKEQKLYQEAIRASNEDIRKQQDEEKLMLERAVQESVELSEREYDDIDAEEIALKQAIIDSLEDSAHGSQHDDEADDDDDLLHRVIMESKALHDASERGNQDDSLKRAILESKRYF